MTKPTSKLEKLGLFFAILVLFGIVAFTASVANEAFGQQRCTLVCQTDPVTGAQYCNWVCR